jgi:amino acid adenylation domain-containing protein
MEDSSNIDKLLEEGAEVSIVEQFRHIVQQYGEYIAVEDDGRLTSYQALDKLSDSIALNLIDHGVIGGDQVAVSLPRSLLLTATLVAILKCGACYVPLDPTAPLTRRRRVLSLSDAKCIVTGANNFDDYHQVNIRAFQVESLIEPVELGADVRLPENANPLACIFFTSGSTGEPKGVLVEQRGVLNVACQPAYVPLSAGDRLANFANPTFDALTFEVWGSLLNGATLVVFSQEELTDTDRLAEKIENSDLDVAFITASLFNLLVEVKVQQVTKIKHVLVGGEAFTPLSAKVYYQACQRLDGQLTSQLYNGYGPTECTTFSTCYPLDSALVDHYIKVGRVPIGQSIKRTQVIVVVDQDRLAKTEEQGEIYISGEGLAQGYNKDTKLTSEKFVRLSWLDPSKRWYRTGDLALINEKKQIEYLGRADQQVKIRGHRIETSEIDNQLLSHPQVTQAVTLAVVQENNSADLHAYLVSDFTLTQSEIRGHVRSQLPDYMTPHRFFSVTHIPLNANGKLDRKALSLMPSEELLSATMSVVEKERLIQQYAPDRGLVIANQCATILGISSLPALDQTFIESGGDSLRAMRLASALKSRFSLGVTVGEILQPISLLELFAILEKKPKIGHPLTELVKVTPAKYLASAEQQRLAFLYYLNPLSSAYSAPYFFYLDEPLKYGALQEAWSHLIERHATLRSCFELENGEIFAVTREMNTELVKISQQQIKRTDLLVELNRFSCQAFDIEKGVLANLHLFRIQGEDTQILAMSFHHLIIDGWSLNVLFEELSQLYLAQVTGEPLVLPELRNTYDDFCAFSRAYRQSDELLVQHKYWQHRIDNVADNAPLFAQSGASAQLGAIATSHIDSMQWQTIKETVKHESVTLFSYTLAAYSLALSQYFKRDVIAVGSPIANRGAGDFEQLIGMFVNTSVFHMDIKPMMTVDQYIQAVHRHVVETQKNQDIDFEDIVSMLPRRTSMNPLFDCMIVLENTDLSHLQFPLTNIKAETGFNGEAKFPMTLFITEDNGSASLCLEYNTSLLNSEVADWILSKFQSYLLSFTDEFSTHLGQLTHSAEESHLHAGLLANDSFHEIIDAVLAAPNKEISRIPLVSAEVQAKIKHWNDTQVFYPKELTFPDLFEAQVKCAPAATACVWLESDNRQHRLTYQELNIRANKLAHKLIDLGAGPGHIVGLVGAWSLNTVLGVLAILKVGAAYLPLDSRNPVNRLKNIIQESGADILLACGAIKEGLGDGVNDVLLLDDLLWESIGSQPSQDPIRSQSFGPKNLAFVIFTSGTTGQPKGVMIEHRNISNLLFSLKDMLDFSAQDTIPSITSPSFDIHVTEIYLPLICGAKVAILDWDEVHTPAKLAACQKHLDISIMQATPATWRMLIDFGWQPTDRLRMITGGDHLTNQLRDLLLGGDNEARLFNLYGPSEATVYCSGAEIKLDTDRIHIGKPLDNNRLYILDEHKNMVPIGIVGELYIAGENVTRGYLNNLTLTNEKYSVDPFAINGERMYQSGDLAKWLPEGTVELIGRKDFQVKINGLRIELGEIENCLCQHKNVEQCIVTTHTASHGEQLLIAYVKSKQGSEQLSLELSEMAKAALPAYMVPALCLCVEAFPVTNNGKIDRAALPSPDFSAPSKAISKAGDNLAVDMLNVDIISTIINTAFTSVLGYSIDLEKSFFEAGANSLLLMKVHGQLVKDNRLMLDGQVLALVDLFNYPSISTLAQYLQANLYPNLQEEENQSTYHKAPMQSTYQDEVAVIGMAVRLPGADNLAEFWQAIKSGKECIETFDSFAHQDDNWVGVISSMSGLSDFDPGYFGLSDQEAKLMDPQHRHGLMSAVHALENAGISPDSLNQKIGVVMCASDNSYQQRIIERSTQDDSPDRYQLSLLNEKDHLATRLAYHLNLKGPAITVQSACSSSLVAIHQACQQLRSGDSEVCLAGGTNADMELLEGYHYRQGMILSRDGHCKPFSQGASGTVPANGVGIVVLKLLTRAKADGDRIYAVIKGSAINNDGNDKVSYYAPSVQVQIDVLLQAHRNAGVTSEQISYVEAHGTGTELGDAIEIKALTDAFAENSKQPQASGACALGSVKSQMGHLGSAAGVTGFIRTALSLYHAVLPPTLWADTPNTNIDFSTSRFYLNSTSRPWRGTNRLAGVSSFGMGGTNAHVILSSVPEGYRPVSEAPAWDAACFTFNCRAYLSKWHCEQSELGSVEMLPEQASFDQLPESQWLMQEQWVRAYRVQRHCVNQKQYLVIDDIHERGISVKNGLRAKGHQVQYFDCISSAIERLPVLALLNQPLTIVNMTFGDQDPERNPISMGSNGCLLSIVTLIQVWEQRPQRQPLFLINLVSGSADVLGEETLNPNAGLLLGLAQTIPLELEHIEYRVLDILPALCSEHLLYAIEGLEQNSVDDAYHFSVRGQYVWRKEYQTLPQCFSPSKKFISDGVYLITGGTGGIGQIIAEHLQATRDARVILLSRTATETILHPGKSIQQLHCDVSKREDMVHVADQVLGQFGKVTGIIHAAGSAGGGMIRLMEPGTATANMAAKILGAINIDSELLKLEPEFIAYCSSMSAVHGVAGQTDYCAANHFLDLYAKMQNQRIDGPHFISINWPTWRGTGMAEQVKDIDFSISPAQGVALLDALVNGGDAQYLISPLEHQNAKRFFSTLHAGNSKVADSMKNNSKDMSPFAYLSSLFTDILGFDEVDEDECFYDLGGDSLTLLDLFDGINVRFPNKVRLADLAQNVTIRRIAEVLSTSSETNVISHLEEGIITCLKAGDSSLGCDIVIHPIGGDLMGYREWIDVMPDGRAIYGIRDPLLLPNTPQTVITVEAMAEHYVDLIQSYQPVRIIGWSFGAFIAWQMTRILENQGKPVSLVMIDPPTLSGVQLSAPVLDNKVFIDEIIQQYPRLKGKLNPQSTPEEVANTLYPLSKLQSQQEERSQAQWYIERVITACQKNAAAISAFHPQGKVATNTLLCIATQHIDDESVKASWQPYLGQIQYHGITADHYSILQGAGAKHIMRLMIDK